MERVLRVASAALFVSLGVLYVAAKIHFFTRFGTTDLDGYLSEHWPYSAGLAAIAALAWVLASLRARIGGQAPEKGSPTTRCS
jgi:hypothetical protein